MAWCSNHLGDIALELGDIAEARRRYQAGADIFRKTDDRWGLARSACDLGHLACDEANYDSARASFRGALTIFGELGHKRGLALALEGLARLAHGGGRTDSCPHACRGCSSTPTSTESGNADIWVYDAVHDRRRQLTTDARDDFNPTSSPDGTIVFASERSGASGLWAMSDAGETSVRQLTTGGDSRPTIAPDDSVVFQRGVIQSAPIELWRMPLRGGTAVQLTQGVAIRPEVSPDGRLVAYYCSHRNDGRLR